MGLLLGTLALTTLIVGALGYRWGWWHFLPVLTAVEWATWGAALGLPLALAGLVQTWRRTRRGRLIALLAVLTTAVPVGMAVQWEVAARVHPAINDIASDTQSPPAFWDMPNPMEHPGEAVAALQRQAYPDLKPLVLNLTPEQTFERALALVRARGWTVVASDPQAGTIEATAHSFLFGFTDEIALRTTADGPNTVLDMRSRSRLGRIDRGVNARRIRAFLSDMATPEHP